MARMIPAVISPNVKSDAEKKIFKWFEEAPNTDDWIVLHSLGIAQHVSLIHGEVDFLVLAPKYGIFALEVKGGRVSRKDGIWYFTNRFGETDSKSRGPFEQAWDAIHSIMEKIVPTRTDIDHKNVEKMIYGIGAMFPDIDYETVGAEEEPWQVFDCKDGKKVRDYIVRLSSGARAAWERTYGPMPKNKIPNVNDVNYLLSILSKDFDKTVALRAKIDYADQELISLTNKQYQCLDQIEENRRVIVYGPAGTGKTLLAMKQARNEVLKGKKVAFICYNSSLGKWFQEAFKAENDMGIPSFVGTFHSLLLDIVKKANETITIPSSQEAKNEFYKNTLPDMALEYLLEKEPEYDEIIIDEAQDLINEKYLDVLDLLLIKGFERGCWKMFGDFSNQAIYSGGMSGQNMFDLIEDRTAFARCKLVENCRNTRQICFAIEIITGFKAPSDLWSKIVGPPVSYTTYKNEDEELVKLEELLFNLTDKEHIENGDIIILSPYTREKSIVSRIDTTKIRDFTFKSGNHITFSTIQSFKGLDSKVVILTDIDGFSPEQLMYVALSRARSGLFVLETKSASEEYNQLFIRRKINA